MRKRGGVYELDVSTAAGSPHYGVADGQLVQYDSQGEPRPLCNFVAEIRRDLFFDDGQTQKRYVDISGQLADGTKFSGLCPIEDFEMRIRSALATLAGAKLRVFPNCANQVLDAIKERSEPEADTVFAHTGWREINNELVFLSPSGGINAGTKRVQIGHQSAARYRVPSAATEQEQADGVRAVLDFLNIAPRDTTWPLLSHVLSAPVLYFLPTAQRTALHLTGLTGSFKTTLASLALSLFGDFAAATQVETWRSTVNALERYGFSFKDLPILIDDFKLATAKSQAVVQLLQTYADGTARGRMNQHGELRQSYPIRGVVLSTGEDVPPGEASLLARMLVLEIQRESVNVSQLSKVQQSARLLPFTIHGMLMWLIENGAAKRELLKQLYEGQRDEWISKFGQTPGFHPRLASGATLSMLGGCVWLAWAHRSGFISQDERAQLMAELEQAWENLLNKHSPNVISQQADAIFISVLKTMISSGRVRIDPRDAPSLENRAPLVGWSDAEFVYLDGMSSVHEVQTYLRQEGRELSFTGRAIWKQLVQSKTVIVTEPPHATTRLRISGRVMRTYKVRRGVIFD